MCGAKPSIEDIADHLIDRIRGKITSQLNHLQMFSKGEFNLIELTTRIKTSQAGVIEDLEELYDL